MKSNQNKISISGNFVFFALIVLYAFTHNQLLLTMISLLNTFVLAVIIMLTSVLIYSKSFRYTTSNKTKDLTRFKVLLSYAYMFLVTVMFFYFVDLYNGVLYLISSLLCVINRVLITSKI